MISYNVTRHEARLISQIVKRAVLEFETFTHANEFDLEMAITAVHANGCPLRLEDMLKGDSFNFLHDIHGMLANFNRNTGKLGNCFLPRYAKGKQENEHKT